MRKVFWLLLAALLIWAWQNPEKVRTLSADASKWIGDKSRVVADKWAPLPPPEPEDPLSPNAPALPELPEDVFLLRQSVTLSTGRETVIWPQGGTVRKLGEGAGKVLVSDGTNQTTLDQSLLTRDPQERKLLEKNVRTATVQGAKANSQALEQELKQVEAKIASLQAELRQVVAARAQLGRQPFGTNEDFLKLAISRQEQRRLEIYKLLGRSAPGMMSAR